MNRRLHPAGLVAAGLVRRARRAASAVAAVALAVALSAVALASAVTAAAAAPDPAISRLCDDAAARAARDGKAPADVLRALTRTETGRRIEGELRPWPWTVNMEGEGHWFSTRREAEAFVEKRRKAGARSFDVGCFQINHRWHGDAFTSVEAMFDPDANASYAAHFLDEIRQEQGASRADWTRIAGAYHSRTPHFAERYSARFARILGDLEPAPPGAGGPRRPLGGGARPLFADGVTVSPPLFERRLASLAAPIDRRRGDAATSAGGLFGGASGAPPGGVGFAALPQGRPLVGPAAGALIAFDTRANPGADPDAEELTP